MPRFMALYMGTQDAEVQRVWDALSSTEKAERSQRAMTAWGEWVAQHQAAIVDAGSPLGTTFLASPQGIGPTKNAIAAYVIVEASSHEAAAEMFRDHPHFSIFPGTGVEIMECLPIPGQ